MATAPKLVALPNPYTMDWQNWADFVVGYNPGLIEQIDPKMPWKEFAVLFNQAMPDSPGTEGFEDWRNWAAAVKQVYQL